MPRKSERQPNTESAAALAATHQHLITPGENCNSVADGIAELLQSVIEDHRICMTASKQAIVSAISAGRKIRAIREYVGRGDWERFLERHITPTTGIRLRTCQRYVETADAWDAFTAGLLQGGDRSQDEFLDQNLIESFRTSRARSAVDRKIDPNAWCTPNSLLQAVQEVLGGVDVDPCACLEQQSQQVATTCYAATDGDQGGLSADLPWRGRCWIAPGHQGDLTAWAERAIQQLQFGVMEAALLMLPASSALQHTALVGFPIAIINRPLTVSARRLKKQKGKEPEVVWKDTLLPTRMAIFYLSHKPNMERFVDAFRDMAAVFMPVVVPASRVIASTDFQIDAKSQPSLSIQRSDSSPKRIPPMSNRNPVTEDFILNSVPPSSEREVSDDDVRSPG